MAGNVVEILIKGINESGPAMAEAKAGAEEAAAGADELAAAQGRAAAKTEESSGVMAGAGAKMKMAFLGIGIGAAVAVKGAVDFQSQTTRLVTSAGESAKNLNTVRQGMLAISAQTATSTSEMAKGMYTVESAGFHGAQGLIVLKAAAQGAKDEGASLATVANGVTDALVDFHLPASAAADVTSKLIAAVSHGKTTFEEFSGSMSTILPLASSLHLKLADVTGMLAEMTSHGISAQEASQQMANAMRELMKPNAAMTKEFGLMGITAGEVYKKLGTAGLSGTMEWLSQVAQKGAGAIGQNYNQALAKLTGSANGLQVALATTGENAAGTQAAIKAVSSASADAQGNVDGFSTVSKTAAFQMQAAKESIAAAGISLGEVLLPAVTAALGPLTSMLQVIAGNRGAAIAFSVVVGGVLAGALGGKLAGALKDAKSGIEGVGSGISWLIGKLTAQTAATEAQTAATEAGTVAQTEADVAMDANPIGAIIIAIVALIAVVVELVKHWHAVAHAFDIVRHAIASGVDWVISFVKSHWPLLLAILTGPIGLAVYAIKGHFTQIVHGAEALAGDVTGFFRSLPGRILHAVGDLGSLLYSAGKAVVEGLIHGIEDMAGNAVSTVENIGSSMLHGAMSVLGISSPSREMAKIGAYVTQGLVLGLQSGIPQLSAMSADLANAVKTAISGGLVGTAQGDALTKYVTEGNDRLKTLAAERKSILGQITAARNFAAQTASSAAGNYALSGFATSGANGGVATVSGIIKGLGLDVGAIRRFTANIKKLAKEGLNRNYLNQLIQMGPDQGGALAAELAAAGLGDIKAINSEEYQISKASGQLGKTAADDMYDTGKNAGKGFLSGLESQQKQIAALMSKIAKSMIDTLKKELGISSPSTVLRWHGQMAGEGFSLGIEDRLQRVASASQRLARAAVPQQGGYGSPAGGGRQQMELVLRFEKSGNAMLDEAMRALRGEVRVLGGDPMMFQRKVAFRT